MTPSPTPTPFLVAMVGEGTAFWDSPFFLAVLAVGGVVIGALLAYWFNRLQDEQKAKREDKQRFDDKMLAFSFDLVSDAQEFALKALAIERHVANKDWGAAMKIRDEMKGMVQRMGSIDDALFVIAPSAVAAKSRQLVRSALRTLVAEGNELERRIAEQRQDLVAFVNQVRRSVGIEAHSDKYWKEAAHEQEERPSRSAPSAE